MSEAVETLQCPRCRTPLGVAAPKRCPACQARIPRSARSIPRDRSAEVTARPLALVERELEARIEAETAASYRERRRAAKMARRIAALPSTVFQDPVAPQSDTWSARTSPTVIDLPPDAIFDVRAAETTAPVTREPELVEPELVEPAFIEVETVEVVAVELADVIEPPAEVVEPEVVEVAEPAVVEPEVVEVVEPDVVEPEPEEPAAESEPATASAPFVPANWTRPDPVWVDRVFNSGHSGPKFETVTWPRPPKPRSDVIDVVEAQPVAANIGDASD